jgi:Fibronectin-III type domain
MKHFCPLRWWLKGLGDNFVTSNWPCWFELNICCAIIINSNQVSSTCKDAVELNVTYVKITEILSGIVLSWNMPPSDAHENAVQYHLYAYQQGHEPPSRSLWKKVRSAVVFWDLCNVNYLFVKVLQFY